MNQFLKGNYRVKGMENVKMEKEKEEKSDDVLQKAFENSALEKLGGSIAFVKKSASFVWKGQKK